MQEAVQEDIPVVWVDTPRAIEASELSSCDGACILVSDPTEDFYENLETLFADCTPLDEYLVQLRFSFVESFKHAESTGVGKRRLDIKSKNMVQRLESQAPKRDGIGAEKGGYPEPGGLVIERLMKKAIKSEAHG